MMAEMTHVQRAAPLEEIKPLIDLCKAGKLFEVQDWIAAGKPVNLINPAKGNRTKNPLEIAIELGFHSLVKVLLKGGASIEPVGWYCPINRALEKRRFDIIKLLVEHGYDPKSVNMENVFQSWDPEIMEYFIDRGGEVEKGNPLASALCERIRTALRIFKKYQEHFPSFQEQANIALRYHCKEGNLKWVSLMLWAGADPYAPGTCDYTEERDSDYEGISALGFAALYEHFEIFELKKIRLHSQHPAICKLIHYLDKDKGIEILKKLLEKGMNPNDQDNGGCSAIQSLLESLEFTVHFDPWSREHIRKDIDTNESREKMKTIHILAKYGAKWAPKDKTEVDSARRSLLKLKSDYIAEFVWIMSKYKACSLEDIQNLLRTPSIKAYISGHSQRIHEMLASWQ
jgi:ankyrin repeat protein